ncbi:LacI family DNA-binding transcriptional regulator [Nonomuraea sp. NPDC050202]|uniref:LacI family DNA-binding transcriptional regulator n=1 Tax=Nonomuraea sp. NPDC050202 TaxID=3155035 RepID=UPI00340611FA
MRTQKKQNSSRVTSWDVADLAGLSRSTVSQVLNGHGDRFNEETRNRVTAAAERLNYRPSRAGRALKTGVTDLIVVAVPNITFGRQLQDTVEQIASESARFGMSVFVRYAGSDPASTLAAILDMRPATVVNFRVFTAADLERIEAAGIRVIPSLDSSQDPAGIEISIGRLQARELLREPKRRLVYALLADTRLDLYGPDRATGAAEEAASRGARDPARVRVPLNREGAREALRPVFEKPEGPLGVCCYNDEVAAAVLSAARSFGLSVPDQVAVVGVDNTDVGQLITPRLTTIAVDLPALVRLLVAALEPGQDETGQRIQPESFITLVPGETS